MYNFESTRWNISTYLRTTGVNRDCPGTGTYDYPNKPGLSLDRKQNGEVQAIPGKISSDYIS